MTFLNVELNKIGQILKCEIIQNSNKFEINQHTFSTFPLYRSAMKHSGFVSVLPDGFLEE